MRRHVRYGGQALILRGSRNASNSHLSGQQWVMQRVTVCEIGRSMMFELGTVRGRACGSCHRASATHRRNSSIGADPQRRDHPRQDSNNGRVVISAGSLVSWLDGQRRRARESEYAMLRPWLCHWTGSLGW